MPSKGFAIACSSPSAVQDIKKVLIVWEERGVYPSTTLQDWEKLVDREESRSYRADRYSSLYAISLARKLKKLRSLEGKDVEGTRDAREDVIREIIYVMKKVDHSHLDTCLLYTSPSPRDS